MTSRAYRRLGLATLLVALAVPAVVFSGLYRKPFEGGGRMVTALFAGTQQLHSGDPVRMDGVEVGHVKSLELRSGGSGVLVTMGLDSRAGTIHRDARARLRWKTLLGAAFYIDLDPGTARAPALGATTIPLRHTAGQVELEDLTSTFTPAARKGLQTLPAELGRALSDHALPAAVLSDFNAVAPSLRDTANGLRGTRRDRDLQLLVTNTGRALRAVDAPDARLRAVVSGLSATVGTTAAREAELRSAVAQGPSLLRSTDATLRHLDTTLSLADPLVHKLTGPAPQVGPTLAALHPTLVDAGALLDRARPLLRSLRPAARGLETASKQGQPLLEGATPSIKRLADTVLPYMGKTDPQTKHSAAQMIGPALAGLGSGGGGQLDNASHFIRFPATVGSSSLYFPCQTYIANPDAKQIVACETLGQLANAFLHYNPLGGEPPPPSARKKGAR